MNYKKEVNSPPFFNTFLDFFPKFFFRKKYFFKFVSKKKRKKSDIIFGHFTKKKKSLVLYILPKSWSSQSNWLSG